MLDNQTYLAYLAEFFTTLVVPIVYLCKIARRITVAINAWKTFKRTTTFFILAIVFSFLK